MDRFRKTSLWRRTLEPIAGEDPDRDARDLLRTAFLSMRDRAAPLVAQVHQDCEGLTVHDLSHLDALWELADRILGEDYPVNPIEAFVFGCAVLVHDAGMAVAAYPDRMNGLKKTQQWRDAVSASLRRAGTVATEDAISSPPKEIATAATFHVLRVSHAAQAENLLQMTWKVGDQSFHLMDESNLREYYGARIGRIAHSHHWDIDRVGREFSKNVGAMVGISGDWSLNEIKVACMLRVADAAHVDERRAPRMLYAIKNPEGVSELHWKFQNKLGQISSEGEDLILSSKDFGVSDAPAWWLCYDVAKLIDNELSSARALLEENGLQAFKVSRIKGLESPKLFSRFVKVSGWEPVQAEVKVSDPVHLASTLGGRNLYGEGFQAPVREIFQNAVDAVRARRSTPGCSPTHGRIRIELGMKGDELLLTIQDDGIGMPQRILVGTLLDFGKSIWNSPALLEEYPGVSGSNMRPVGKFGIGFFSIFLLGKDVVVASRKYDAGLDGTMVLDFSSLVRRPVLRKSRNELPYDMCTSVSVVLENKLIGLPLYAGHQDFGIFDYLKQLSAGVDIDVELVDNLGDRSYKHSHNWEGVDGEIFLRELYATINAPLRDRIVKAYSGALELLEDENGEVYGRAALSLEGDARGDWGFISVEGISYQGINRELRQYPHGYADEYTRYRFLHDEGPRYLLPFVGLMRGATEDASRRGAYIDVPREVIIRWASEQAKAVPIDRFEAVSLIPLSHEVFRSGGQPGPLPFCFCGGKLIPEGEARGVIRKSDQVHLLLGTGGDNTPQWRGISRLPTTYYVNKVRENIFAISDEDRNIFSGDAGRKMLLELPTRMPANEIPNLSDRAPEALFRRLVDEEWVDGFDLLIQWGQVFAGEFLIEPQRRPLLTFSRR